MIDYATTDPSRDCYFSMESNILENFRQPIFDTLSFAPSSMESLD